MGKTGDILRKNVYGEQPDGVVGARMAGANAASVPAPAPEPPKEAVPAPEISSYSSIMKEIDKLENPVDDAKEAKRRRSEAIISAIGDGISSLSNLYFTSKGANSSFNPNTSLSAANKAKWDKLDYDRKKWRQERLAYLSRKADAERDVGMQLLKMRMDKAERDRNYDLAVEKAADARRRDDRNYDLGKEREANANKRHKEAIEVKKSEGAKNRAASSANARIKAAGSAVVNGYTSDWYDMKVGEIYNELPDEYKKGVGNPQKDIVGNVIGYDHPTVSQMKEAIGRAMKDNPRISERVGNVFRKNPSKEPKRSPSPLRKSKENETDW